MNKPFYTGTPKGNLRPLIFLIQLRSFISPTRHSLSVLRGTLHFILKSCCFRIEWKLCSWSLFDVQYADSTPKCDANFVSGAAEINCVLIYSGTVQPSLVCTPGSDDNVEVNGFFHSPVQSLIYKKRILQWDSDILHIKCAVTAVKTPGLADIWTKKLATGDVVRPIYINVAFTRGYCPPDSPADCPPDCPLSAVVSADVSVDGPSKSPFFCPPDRTPDTSTDCPPDMSGGQGAWLSNHVK
jgi:hypothetical protein